MRKAKKILAIFLTMAILYSFIPMTVLAEDDNSAQSLGHTGNNSEEALIYNLGNHEVSVKVDGNYTIQLENNAFFPYEIQFKYAGQTTVEIFDTPDSTVTIGGHVISVTSNYDDDAISQIGIWINGEYIAVTPKKKEFTNPSFVPFSLLPLARQDLNLDIRHLSLAELYSVEISAIIGGLDPAQNFSGKTVLWNYDPYEYNAKDYKSLERYSPLPSGQVPIDEYYVDILTFIVGTSNQLDASAKKYVVNVQKFERLQIDLEFYSQNTQDDRILVGSDNALRIGDSGGKGGESFGQGYSVITVPAKYPLDSEYYLGMSTSSGSLDSSYQVEVYKDWIWLESDLPSAVNLTGSIWEQDMQQANKGHKANYYPVQDFTFVVKHSNKIIWICRISVRANPDKSYVDFGGIWHQAVNSDRTYALSSWFWVEESYDYYNRIYNPVMGSGYSPDQDLYIHFPAYNGNIGEYDNSIVTKAVVGHYDTMQAAAGQPDIKSQLIATYGEMSSANKGYKINLKNSARFTIFVDDEVYKFTITTGANDETYFDITGVEGIDSNNMYKVLSKDDSGVQQFGYRAMLINDSTADFSALKPTFISPPGAKIYANNELQISGQKAHDFSNNNSVQYDVVAENGKTESYWVTFVKATTSAAKLFVVVDGQKPGEREVFLANYTNYQHDIFIANVGNQTLTGLNVELRNPANVTLDNYWNIGGSGNNIIAPFISNGNAHGENDNIAKIRLIPDGRGAISGTLVISSANGGTVEIELIGVAGEPEILTTQNDFDRIKAVKYVPYEFKIMDANKYRFNTVKYEFAWGDLPDGLSFSPSGVIYGVPRESGEFWFTVRMLNSFPAFGDSYERFKLAILDNTTTNVASANDFTITNFVGGNHGGTITSYQNTLFRTEAPYEEFINFWIDGEKMVAGVDYTAEPGSTAITILAQTFQKFGTGMHTIAGEFRKNRDSNEPLKRVSQNYVATTVNNNRNSDNSDDSSDSGDSTAAIPATQQKARVTGNTLERMIFRLINADFVSLSDLKKLAEQAGKEGKFPWLNVDTLLGIGRAVDVRVGINPALAKTGLNLAGSTTNDRALKTKALFEKFFKNEIIAVISLTQKGEFGQSAVICAKVPLDTNVDDFVFYSYNPETNIYLQIKDANPKIDKNGYLHFTTTLANQIIITKGLLVKK